MIPIYGALAVSAVVLLFVSAVVAATATNSHWTRSDRLRPFAWTAFTASIVLFLAAIWTAAAT